jgi:hypothetical protein
MGYITPKDMLAGHPLKFRDRDRNWMQNGNSGRNAASAPLDG